MMKVWSIDDSLKTYNIENWGLHYFGVNPKGNLTVQPRQTSMPSIDLKGVVDDIVARGIKLPVLIRFQDILRHRVVMLNEAFKRSIEENNYKGKYQGVYPIKVNQLREVVEEILDAGAPYKFGIEAGSKAELVASIAMNTNPDSLILCNGYKDYSIIKTALTGIKLGKRVIIIVEKLSELTQIMKVAREMGVTPQIGIRCKLQTTGSGKWASSGGESAKFGLTTPEILQAVKTLRDENMLSCVKLVHFHIGSQITDIRTIKDATKKPHVSTPNSAKWASILNSSMWGADWAPITTVPALHSILRPTIRFKNMSATSFTRFKRFALLKKFQSQTLSVSRAVRS